MPNVPICGTLPLEGCLPRADTRSTRCDGRLSGPFLLPLRSLSSGSQRPQLLPTEPSEARYRCVAGGPVGARSLSRHDRRTERPAHQGCDQDFSSCQWDAGNGQGKRSYRRGTRRASPAARASACRADRCPRLGRRAAAVPAGVARVSVWCIRRGLRAPCRASHSALSGVGRPPGRWCRWAGDFQGTAQVVSSPWSGAFDPGRGAGRRRVRPACEPFSRGYRSTSRSRHASASCQGRHRCLCRLPPGWFREPGCRPTSLRLDDALRTSRRVRRRRRSCGASWSDVRPRWLDGTFDRASSASRGRVSWRSNRPRTATHRLARAH